MRVRHGAKLPSRFRLAHSARNGKAGIVSALIATIRDHRLSDLIAATARLGVSVCRERQKQNCHHKDCSAMPDCFFHNVSLNVRQMSDKLQFVDLLRKRLIKVWPRGGACGAGPEVKSETFSTELRQRRSYPSSDSTK